MLGLQGQKPKPSSGSGHDLEMSAHALAKRLPALLVEARRVAQTVAHGIHGRRRAGPGETFWQFRQYEQSEAAHLIDWRRSGGSDHLFIREREWEAAHTVRLWTDLSPSMVFRSHLAADTKRDRALVLTFAIGELLIDGGERVGLLGGAVPSSGRKTIPKIAMALARDLQQGKEFPSLPPRTTVSRFSECILFSDFLDPPETLTPLLEHIAGQGVRGHLIQILDPAEETLPYNGRVEFAGIETADRMLAPRAEDLRKAYTDRLARHKEAIMSISRRLEWSYLLHHTDRPAGEALLALHTHLSGQSQSYRAKSAGGASTQVQPDGGRA
jgi:uncharacterized protein (DUF58 family)